MDPIRNPYAPGAGTPPPELAGRDELLKQVAFALERIRIGNPSKSMVMVGLRGVGKTVLLDRIRQNAENAGICTVRVEAPERRSLPAMLAPQLRQALIGLSRLESAKDYAMRAMRGLAGFAKALKVKYQDLEVGIDLQPEPGLADNGDLISDLQTLLGLVGDAAQQAKTALCIFIDEIHYVEEDELAALITALHYCAQRKLPVVLVGAGLPQLRGKTGKAKSYAERLFDLSEIGPLTAQAAEQALCRPAKLLRVDIDKAAVDRVIELTQGYPYFLQEWGKQMWEVAARSPITLDDVHQASELVIAALDASFFRVRFDRLTPKEKQYLRAMAESGPGPHRSGDIAQILDREVTALGPVRNQLINKGMIWSPSHGDNAFTVPLFDQFMKRIMPGNDWLS